MSIDSPHFPRFTTVAAKVSTIEAICTLPQSESWISEDFKRRLLPGLVSGLWPCLSPSLTKHNLEAARCIWRLHTISTDKHLIESTISTLLRFNGSDEDTNPIDIEDARRFTTLWTHSLFADPEAQKRPSNLVSTVMDARTDLLTVTEVFPLERPLMQLLDILAIPQCSLFFFVVSWLSSLHNVHVYVFVTFLDPLIFANLLYSIIGMLIERLSALLPVSFLEETHGKPSEESKSHDSHEPTDVTLRLYYLQLVLSILQYCPNNIWPALIRNGKKTTLSNITICIRN